MRFIINRLKSSTGKPSAAKYKATQQTDKKIMITSSLIMRLLIGLFIAMMICQTLAAANGFLRVSSDPLPFVEEYFYPKSIVVAFNAESIHHRSGEIEFTLDKGVVNTHIESFNQLAAEHRIVDMKQLHPNVTHPDWNESGVYIQNIYRLILEDNHGIENAQFALQHDDSIIFAEYETINRHFYYTPNDPMFSQQWHHRKIESPLAWDFVKGSREVVIAITDSGAKWNHPDLADNIWINEAELPGMTIVWETAELIGGDGIDNDMNGKVDDVLGWDFFHNRNNPYQNFPGNHHGSHVAGCAGAVGDNGVGVTGVAMNVSLMICKGQSSYQEMDNIRDGYLMIQYAAQTGADIINCSWGGPGNGNYANSIVTYAHNLGSLVISAAGNENTEHNAGYMSFPANAIHSMNIAATDRNDQRANFSDYGIDIDLSAPGVGILSTWGNNGYHAANGTSMAAPLVSGAAAMIKTLHPNMTNVQIWERLKETADYIDDYNQDYIGKLGTGRLNLFSATMFDKVPKISLIDHSIEEYDGDNDGVPNPGETVDLSISLYNEIFWMPATGVTATLSSRIEGVEIIIETVDIPNIHGGSVSFNHNNPLRFRTDPLLSEYNVPLTLTVKANQQNTYPYRVEIDFEAQLSLQKQGWPFPLTGSSTSPALIADITVDNNNEIIFGDSQGNLHVVREDKSYLPGFPVELGSNINSAVAAADLNGNNRVEIVANTLAGRIYCIDNEGNILFNYDAGGQFRNNPMITDVNGNGNYEIVAVSFTNPKLFVINHDGTDFPQFPVSIPAGVISSPASADLNGDGNEEIIFVTATGNMHAISTATGTDIAGFPVSLGATSWSGPTVGDISGNGEPDIAVATVQGAVLGYDRTGARIMNRSVGSPIRTAVLVFDIDHSGESEIIFGDMSGRLFVMNSSGNDLTNFPINVGAAIESSPILADMTRNYNYDIIFGDSSGWLHSVNRFGGNTPNFPVYLNRALTVSPTIGYVGQLTGSEADNADILIPNENGYQYVDFKRRVGSIGWGTFKGNMRRSGNSFNMTSVENQDIMPELATRLKGNFPNPFNPNTTINYTVGESSNGSGLVPVNITVYNIRGQVITTLVDKDKRPGSYSVRWNGKDANGVEVGSGVYFYTMTTTSGREVLTRKMILVK